jgi:divalent metal cation (Fe/Co/Zn/Cd) transporter
VREVVALQPQVQELLNLIAVQQGPGEVLMALKVRLAPDLTTAEVCQAINRLEQALKQRRPDVRWLFVEPDLRR